MTTAGAEDERLTTTNYYSSIAVFVMHCRCPSALWLAPRLESFNRPIYSDWLQVINVEAHAAAKPICYVQDLTGIRVQCNCKLWAIPSDAVTGLSINKH